MLQISETRKIELLLLFSLVVAFLNDVLVRWKEGGVGTTLVLVLFIGGLYYFARLFGVLKHKKILLLFIPVGVLVLDTLLYSNTLADVYIPKIVALLTFIIFILATARAETLGHLYLRHVHLFYRLDKYFNVLSSLRKKFQTVHNGEQQSLSLAARVTIGILAALPITALFIYLFARADLIFNQGLKHIFSSMTPGELVVHVLFVLFLTIIIVVVAGTIFSSENTLATPKERAVKNDLVIAHIILWCVNIVFAIFVFIQFKYLFGNATFVFENNITFADYARHGFFELVFVALLSGLIIFAIQRSYSKLKAPLGVLVLQLLLSAQVGVVAVSAIKRMNVYQEAFGYTVLRLYVEWFLYFLLVIIFVSAVVLIKRETFKAFFQMSAILSICALAVVGSMNIDGIITKKNVGRFVEKTQGQEKVSFEETYTHRRPVEFRKEYLDWAYLGSRSFEAMPHFVRLTEDDIFNKLPSDIQLHIGQVIKNKEIELNNLGWYEWTIGAWRVRYAIASIEASRYVFLRKLYENNQKVEKGVYLDSWSWEDHKCPQYKIVGFLAMTDRNLHSCVMLEKNGEPYVAFLARLYRPDEYLFTIVRVRDNIIDEDNVVKWYLGPDSLGDRSGGTYLLSDGSILTHERPVNLLYIKPLLYNEDTKEFYLGKKELYEGGNEQTNE